MQPIDTSAHRRPHLHIPDSLQDCSHVFVRRGGVQSSLASPYIGPYRVVSRSAHNFKLSIPGKGTETVAIARLKPAVTSDDAEEDPDPPTPPPPGRRPGIRTRQPQQTTRTTRQQTQERQRARSPPPVTLNTEENSEEERRREEVHEDLGGASTSAAPEDRVPQEWGDIPFNEEDAPPPLSPQPSTSRQQPDQHRPAPRPRFFSKPRPKNFSYQKRPDVTAIASLIRNHLAIDQSNKVAHGSCGTEPSHVDSS